LSTKKYYFLCNFINTPWKKRASPEKNICVMILV